MSNVPTLEERIANQLQSRMDWRKAEGCARDIIDMLDRMGMDSPLTCQFCNHAPVLFLSIVDWRLGKKSIAPGTKRQMMAICKSCRESERDSAVKDLISLGASRSGLVGFTTYRLIPE